MLYDNLGINEKGHLTIGGADTVDIASEFGTALYVMDENKLRSNIRTYVDGQEQLYFENDHQGNNDTWPFNKPFYPILNVAWGGDWGGYKGVDESALPLTMEVDYVRVWQKE